MAVASIKTMLLGITALFFGGILASTDSLSSLGLILAVTGLMLRVKGFITKD